MGIAVGACKGSREVQSQMDLNDGQAKSIPPWIQKLGRPEILHYKTLQKALRDEYRLIKKKSLPKWMEKARIEKTAEEFEQFILENKNLAVAMEMQRAFRKNGGGRRMASLIFSIAGSVPIACVAIMSLATAQAPDWDEFQEDPLRYPVRYSEQVFEKVIEKVAGNKGQPDQAVPQQQKPQPKQKP